jgi:hypothetical protein
MTLSQQGLLDGSYANVPYGNGSVQVDVQLKP